MGRRLGARIIDVLIVGVVLVVLGGILFGSAFSGATVDPQTGQVTSGQGGIIAATFAYTGLASALTLAYEVVLVALRGATLGKQALGLRVVREADGQIPGWGPSILRWLIPTIGSFVCGIGQLVVYLSPFFDSSGRNQGWHDKVAHTVVVQR
jgi:uncharacterized RDD family membrane protein YckC